MLIKYIKSVLWRVAKCLSYIEEARCLKVKLIFREFLQKKSTGDRVLRIRYNKITSVNYVLKFYFERVHWRKPQKYQENLECFARTLCPFISTTKVQIGQYFYRQCQHPAVPSRFLLLSRGKRSRSLDSPTTHSLISSLTAINTHPALVTK